MADAYLRYEIFEPMDPSAVPSGNVLGFPYASGTLLTRMAEFSEVNGQRVLTTTSEASEPFTLPASPTGAKRVLVRLWAGADRVLVTVARNLARGEATSDPPIPEFATQAGPDPYPYVACDLGDPVLMVLEPGAKIRARASYSTRPLGG